MLDHGPLGAAGAIALLEAPSFHWTHIDSRRNPLGPGVLAADSARPFTAAHDTPREGVARVPRRTSDPDDARIEPAHDQVQSPLSL